MRHLIWLVIIGIGLVGCSSNGREKEGSVVRFGSDSFTVRYDEHHVTGSEFIQPISVLDQMNPRYRITLENSQSFTSGRTYQIGEQIVFKTYVKLR